MPLLNLEIFEKHAEDMLSNPLFRNWKPLVDGKARYGLVATGPDKDDVIRTIIIKPSARYPLHPPITRIEPIYRDPCWDSQGMLHFVEEGGNLSWSRIVAGTPNPLIYLVEELLDKYNLAV